MAVLRTKGQMARSPVSPNAAPQHRCGVSDRGRSRFHQIVSATLLSLGAWGVMLVAPGQGGNLPPREPQLEATSHNSAAHSSSVPLLVERNPLEPANLLAQTKSPGPSSQAREPSEPEAPSVVWLIVMPAIPIVGGAFIYVSRRLWGRKPLEKRSLHKSPSEEPTPCQSLAPQPTDLETDSLRD
jgi:hypothetical protein